MLELLFHSLCYSTLLCALVTYILEILENK